MGIGELGDFLEERGFKLRRPRLADPKFTAEITIGEKHYQYFGEGKLYAEDAKTFAAEHSHNGQIGRILTLRCRAEEDKINAWIQSVTDNPVEAWIGCSDDDHETQWKWENVDDAAELLVSSYSNWREGEPNNANGKENCATIIINQGWNDVACHDAANVIIEFGPSRSSECEHVISDAHGQQQVDL